MSNERNITLNRKYLMVAAAAAGIGTLGFVGIAAAADESKPASLATAIAEKFNLKESEVQAVINTHKDEMRLHREERLERRLDEAVQDKKITQAQKEQILAKHKEVMEFKASLRDKTPAEAREAAKQKHEEIKQWVKDNNIPTQYFGGDGTGHHLKGAKLHMHE